ncbi:hypothetical protein HMPREF1989_02344 [Porphyromonas gingivalis F0566]|nr:hypothetical protein HMPREF1989_02344 [Porphyromonas gingivalis F0566]
MRKSKQKALQFRLLQGFFVPKIQPVVYYRVFYERKKGRFRK